MYTDLEQAGVLTDGPLLYRFNDVNYRWVAQQDWVYQLQFDGMSLPIIYSLEPDIWRLLVFANRF